MNKWYQDSSGSTSGKRIFGAIAICLFMVIGSAVAIYSVYTGNDIGNNAADLIKTIGWVGGSLLGIGVVEKLGGIKK